MIFFPAKKQNSPQAPLSYGDKSITVASLLSTRQWALLETLLTSTSGPSILVDDATHPHAITPDIAVHLAVRLQAPLGVIYLISQTYPRSNLSSDFAGRYPIHVAAKWGAAPNVIAFLIEKNPSVAGVPDTFGKTPMHYVAECYLQHFNGSIFDRDNSLLEVVRLLKDAAPISVNLEDDNGMNAIEHALMSGADLGVIKMMQCACRDDWRHRVNVAHGSRPGRRRHQDLITDIETAALKLKLQGGYTGYGW